MPLPQAFSFFAYSKAFDTFLKSCWKPAVARDKSILRVGQVTLLTHLSNHPVINIFVLLTSYVLSEIQRKRDLVTKKEEAERNLTSFISEQLLKGAQVLFQSILVSNLLIWI